MIHDNCIVYTLHDAGIGTWGSYTKWMICMLQVWVHYACIICTIACYGIGRIIFLIVISFYSTYYSQLCFSEINRFCMDLVSSRLCWVICSFIVILFYSTYYSQLCFSEINRFCMDLVYTSFCWVICSFSFYPCLQISWGCGFHNLPSFFNCRCKLRPCTWTAGSNLSLGLASSTGTHISVEVVIFLQLPNSY